MKSIIYARYSSHNQREESIEDQVRVCEQAAESDGDEVVAVYFDRATSGTTDRRDGFQAMIADAKGATWERVWTYKTDRFARNRYDAAIYKRKLQRCGVAVKCAAEPIPDGAMGVIMESVLEGMAEYYSANLGENVRRGQRGNALKCHPNGQIRYGWDIAGARVDEAGKRHPGDHYVINEREAGAVRIMYRMRVAGHAWTAIAAHLDRLGHRNKYGRPITDAMVRGIVGNDAYRGVYRFGDVVADGGIPRIVSDAEWFAAQHPRRRRRRKHVRVRAGMVFGNLEVLEVARVDGHHHYLWLCRCRACGRETVEWATRLTSGRATDCGCLSGDERERDELGRYA